MERTVKMEIFKIEDSCFEQFEQSFEIGTVTEIPAVRLSDEVFEKYLTKYGQALLSKSQRPNEKMKKNKAAAKISQSLRSEMGISYTPRQILKNLHNLKSKLKAKQDACVNEGCKLKLNPAEKVLLNLMHGTGRTACNDADSAPNVHKISDANSKYDANGIEFTTHKPAKSKNVTMASRNSQQKGKHGKFSAFTSYTNKLPNDLESSTEVDTEGLSLEQLERIAMLKQLKILDVQERSLQKQLIVAELRLAELTK